MHPRRGAADCRTLRQYSRTPCCTDYARRRPLMPCPLPPSAPRWPPKEPSWPVENDISCATTTAPTPSRCLSELSWSHLGASWAILGSFRGHLGAILGPSWAFLGPPGAILGHLGAVLGPSWSQLLAAGCWLLASGCLLLAWKSRQRVLNRYRTRESGSLQDVQFSLILYIWGLLFASWMERLLPGTAR